MALSAPIPAFKGRLYAAQAAEATFGSAATLTHVLNTRAMKPLRVDQATANNSELMTGYEGPTLQVTLERSLSATIPLWPAPETLGLFFGFLMGVDSITTASGYGIHALTNAALSVPAYGMTLEGHQNTSAGDDDIDSKHLGTYPVSITLSGGRTGMVQMDVEVLGSGGASSSSSPTEGSLLKETYYFPTNKAKLVLKAEGSEGATAWGGSYTAPTGQGAFANSMAGGTDLSQHVENWTIKCMRQLQAGNSGGSSSTTGIIGTQPAVVRRSATAQINWILDAATKLLVKALFNSSQANNAGYTLTLELVSDLAAGVKIKGALIVLPLVKFTKTPEGQATLDLASDQVNFETHDQTSGTNYGHFLVFVTDANQSVYCHA